MAHKGKMQEASRRQAVISVGQFGLYSEGRRFDRLWVATNSES